MAKTLPPLKVQFQKDGQPDGVKEIDDPRTQYCEEYNRAGEQFGRTAKPILAGASLKVQISEGGEPRNVVEFTDPRTEFCRHFNELEAESGGRFKAAPVGLVEITPPEPLFAVVDESGKVRMVAEADNAARFANRSNEIVASKGHAAHLRLVELALFAKADAAK